MNKIRRVEITVERDEVLVIRNPGRRRLVHCPVCAETVRMITAEEAAILAGVSTRTISCWLESGRIHHTETAEGLLLVCLKSLSRDFIKEIFDVI
jgi:hypothetical protein